MAYDKPHTEIMTRRGNVAGRSSERWDLRAIVKAQAKKTRRLMDRQSAREQLEQGWQT